MEKLYHDTHSTIIFKTMQQISSYSLLLGDKSSSKYKIIPGDINIWLKDKWQVKDRLEDELVSAENV